MANPMYGQNKLDAKLQTIANAIPGGVSVQAHKVMTFDIAVDNTSSGVGTNGADTGYKIPANSLVTHASIINTGSVDLAAGAKTLDVVAKSTTAIDLTASAAALAAGDTVSANLGIYVDVDTAILADGAIQTGSGSTTLKVVIHYIALNEISA